MTGQTAQARPATWRHAVPLGLIALRALLGPVVLVLAWRAPLRPAFAACLVLALVSDILDGVLARRLGVATASLRRLDSIADSVFYACALVAVWLLHPAILRSHALLLGILVALEVARYAFDLAKFGREASYHMWSSKLWGLALFAGFYAVLVQEGGELLAVVAIALGIVADIEGLLISIVLPSWRHDVPTLVHAFRLRAGMAAADGRAGTA